MAQNPGKLMLIDGNSLFHRAFHALPTMTTSSGQHTNAVYGFATMLMRLLDDEKPEYAAVAFDRAAPTFRHTAYEAYKAHRPPMADELRTQIPLVRELVTGFNLPIVELDGYEADDVLGTLACRGQAAGFQVVIVTGDKDALQLVQPGLAVLITRKGISEMERYDAAKVAERFGITPPQVIDLKALMGDASDNIPGVAGIGEKTAVKLLKEYGSLETILAHAHEIKGKAGEALRTHRDDAIMSQALATIDINAPVTAEPNSLERKSPDFPTLATLFTKLEARSLLTQLEKRFKPDTVGVTGSLFPAPSGGPDNTETENQLQHNNTQSQINALPGFGGSDNQPEVAMSIAVVTDKGWQQKVDALQAPIYAVAALQAGADGNAEFRVCSAADNTTGVVAVGDAALQYASLLVSERHVVAHDVKAQWVAVVRLGAAMPEPEQVVHIDDLQVASYLVNPAQGDHSLPDLAVKNGFAPPSGWPTANLELGSASEWQAPLTQRYAVMRAAQQSLRKQMENDELFSLYRDVEMPLLAVLAHMEATGIAIDRERLAGMSTEMAAEVERLTAEIYAAAGTEFNINSPKQLASVMFDKLKLPVLKETKTGPSTSADVLEQLAEEHELPRLLLDYRQLVKLAGTYVDALPQQIHPRTGRIHTTFNQTVAATGRLSSTNPNLQNIPVRTALGKQIRSAFVPGIPGWQLISADYSQIELRVLAHLSEDENLVAAFRANADIHTKTAAEVFGVDPTEVTSEMRSGAKAINFGIVYGISSFGLARGTGLSRSDAQAYIKSYFARYPGVKRYMENSVATGKALGYVSTILGRRRYLPDLHSRRWPERSFAERTAMNTPIQGSAADIIKLAMVNVYKRLRDEGLRTQMLLQVHDELLFEAPPEELNDAVAIIREEMEGAYTMTVPLKVDVGAGANWLDIEDLADA